MKIIITSCPWKVLARKAGDIALDAAAALRECGGVLGRCCREKISSARLRREIRDLREEIDLQMRSAGQIMYAAHRGGPSGDSQIQTIFSYVDGLEEELDAHIRERETLRGLLVCPGCGAANSAGSLYCQNCGKALSRE